MYFCLLMFVGVLSSCCGEQAILNDEPGGNFTIMFREIPGQCPELPEAKTVMDPQLMEGRWIGIQVGFMPSQARNLECFAWDSFFDQEGVLHNFISVLEDGVPKTINSRLTPTNKFGIYILDAGAQNNDVFISSLYYNDGEIFIFSEVVCRENGNHYRNVVIGVRDLQIVQEKSALIDQIVRQLEYEGGFNSDKTLINQENCMFSYPEFRSNPYTSFTFPNPTYLQYYIYKK